MCSWSEASLPLNSHLAFSEQAVSCEFPSCKSVLINSSAMLFFDFCLPCQSLLAFVHSCHSASSGFANAYMQCYMQCTNTFFKEDVKTSFSSFSAVSNYRYIINEADIYLS